MKRVLSFVLLSLVCSAPALAEDVKIATYNIEHWNDRFNTRAVRAMARKLPKADEVATLAEQVNAKLPRDGESKKLADQLKATAAKLPDEKPFEEMIDAVAKNNDKLNWATAEVIKQMDPDVMVFEEGCNQEDLNYFGRRWLQDAYPTLKVFPTNTGERNQHIGLIAKPGFKILATKDQYYLEKDPVDKASFASGERNGEAGSENRLFARGPAFVLLESPGGNTFWLGVHHGKSKSGNSLDVTKWRNREAARVHAIMMELQKQGPAEVVFGGDLNDELGAQEFEQEAGGDSIALIQGPPADGVVLATRKLAESNGVSFGGYFNTRYRSMIDHFFVTKSLADNVGDVKIVNDGFAPMASDHYPVVMTLKF